MENYVLQMLFLKGNTPFERIKVISSITEKTLRKRAFVDIVESL